MVYIELPCPIIPRDHLRVVMLISLGADEQTVCERMPVDW
jgi:hypothetical protein